MAIGEKERNRTCHQIVRPSDSSKLLSSLSLLQNAGPTLCSIEASGFYFPPKRKNARIFRVSNPLPATLHVFLVVDLRGNPREGNNVISVTPRAYEMDQLLICWFLWILREGERE